MSEQHQSNGDDLEPEIHMGPEPEPGMPSKVVEKGLALVFIKLNASFGEDQGSRLIRRISTVSGPMGSYAIGAIIHELLDTSLPDMLSTVGKAHFESARDTLSELPHEDEEARRREIVVTAGGSLRDAYQFHRQEAEARKKVILATKLGMIGAHRRALEAAAYMASINRHLGSSPTNVAKWAEHTKYHFSNYVQLSRTAAENGIAFNRLARVGGAAGGAAAAVGGGLAGIALGIGGNRELIKATAEKISLHEDTKATLAAEQVNFNLFYAKLIGEPSA